MPFLAVFEATKKGWPHLHILSRAKWLDQKWLSNRMRQLIGAPVCDVRTVKNARHLSWYLAKYIGKNPHHFEGTKRYWRSLDYFTPAPLDDPAVIDHGERWEPIEANWMEMVAALEAVGFVATISRNSAELMPGIPP